MREDRLFESELEVIPVLRHRLHALIVRHTPFQHRQQAAAISAVFTEHNHARAFSEARTPGTDRRDHDTAIVADLPHHRADRIDMRDHGPCMPRALTRQPCANRAAARESILDPELRQQRTDVTHDLVGKTARARNRKKFQ